MTDRYFLIFFNALLDTFPLMAFAIIMPLNSCEFSNHKNQEVSALTGSQAAGNSTIKHAKGFDILEYDHYDILYLFRHYNDHADTLAYILKNRNARVPAKYNHLHHLEVPVAKIALLHSSYLSFFEFSQTKESISALSEVKYVYDDDIYRKVKANELPEVGYGETLDKERLLELNVDVVVTVGWPNTPNKSQQLLEELGIPVLILSDWQENTLLGRCEWVKVIAAITGKTDFVDTKFNAVSQKYDSLKNLISGIGKMDGVICNLPYKGSWYMPGGNSYMSNVLKDAGVNYLWSDDPGTGGIQIDFEAVYAKGLKSDFWINPGFVQSKEEILEKDERLKDFQPIKLDKVYNSNNRVSRGVANDYFESGIVNPHIILADLIGIFHPQALPDYELYYYRQVK